MFNTPLNGEYYNCKDITKEHDKMAFKKHGYWDFIEENYLNYTSSDEILMSDIMTKYIDNEQVDEADIEYLKSETTDENFKEYYIKHELAIFEKALRGLLEDTKIKPFDVFIADQRTEEN